MEGLDKVAVFVGEHGVSACEFVFEIDGVLKD